ncbi:hypothetical protein B0H19DRAFT_1262468 [Mycena capillaripes]|nr:hypothetical protein B0H19DRAFT_1262468 [Mycena capillaripes]
MHRDYLHCPLPAPAFSSTTPRHAISRSATTNPLFTDDLHRTTHSSALRHRCRALRLRSVPSYTLLSSPPACDDDPGYCSTFPLDPCPPRAAPTTICTTNRVRRAPHILRTAPESEIRHAVGDSVAFFPARSPRTRSGRMQPSRAWVCA